MPEGFSDIEKACRAKQNEGKEEIRPADRELTRTFNYTHGEPLGREAWKPGVQWRRPVPKTEILAEPEARLASPRVRLRIGAGPSFMGHSRFG